MSRPNSPYNEDSSTLSTLIGTGILAGGAYGAYKYASDKNSFTSAVNRFKDKVAPYHTPEKSTAEAKTAKIYEAISNAAPRARERNRILDANKIAKAEAKKGKYVTISPKGNGAVNNKPSYFTELSEVTDAAGNSIGEKFTEILNKRGYSAQFSHFDGTEGVFKLGEGGELRLPFANFNEQTGAWIETRMSESGMSRWVHPYKLDLFTQKGKMGATVIDPNTHLLKVLEDLEVRGVAESGRADLARDAIQIMERRANMTPKQIAKEIALAAAKETGSVGTEQAMINQLQRTIRDATRSAQHLQGNSPHLEALYASEFEVTNYSRYQLSKRYKGIDSVSVGLKDLHTFRKGSNPEFSKDTIKSMFNLAKDIREDPSLIRMDLYGHDEYQTLTTAVNPNVSRILSSTQQNIGFVGPQSQTAKMSLYSTRSNSGIRHAEANKAYKGLSFYGQDDWDSALSMFSSKGRQRRLTPRLDKNGNPIERVIDRRLRMMPGMIDPSAVNDPILKHYARGGQMNIFGLLNPATNESISLNRTQLRDIKVASPRSMFVESLIEQLTTPVPRKIDGELVTDFTAREAEVDVFFHGEPMSRKMTLAELYSSPGYEDVVRGVRGRAGQPIGINKKGAQIFGDSRDATATGSEEIVRFATDFIQDQADVKKTFRDLRDLQARGNGGLMLHGKYIEDPSKLLLSNTTLRGAVDFNDGLSTFTTDIAEYAGSVHIPEAAFSVDHWTKALLGEGAHGEKIMGKNIGAALPFMQDVLRGHAIAFEDKDLVLKGDAATKFASYLTDPLLENGELNLMDQVFGPGLQFKPEFLEEQMLDIQGIIGVMRQDGYNGASISDLGAARQFGNTLVDDLNYLMTDEGKSIFTQMQAAKELGKLPDGFNVTTAQVKRAFIPMMAGFSPQETPLLAQGEGFNVMRVGFRDLHYLQEMPGVVEELASNNLVNTTKIIEQAELLERSLAGEDVTKFTNAKILNPEEVKEMMGAYGHGPGSRFNLQDPLHYADSFLSVDKNPNGFLIRGEDRLIHIPSAELFRSGYYLPDEEKVTLTDFAYDVHSLLNKYVSAPDGELSKEAIDNFAKQVGMHGHSTKSGILREAAFQVEGAFYNLHVPDNRILSEGTRFMQTAAKDEGLFNALGNMTKISKWEYATALSQKLQDFGIIAEKTNKGLMDVIQENLGTGSIFDNDIIRGLEAEEVNPMTADNIARRITEQKSKAGKVLEHALNRFEQTGNEKYSSLAQRIIDEHSMAGLVNRPPSIYAKSYAMTSIMPDWNGSLEGKRLSMGTILNTLMNADHDGDKIQTLMLFSSTSRQTKIKELNGAQKTAYEMMKIAGDRKALGVMHPNVKFKTFAHMGENEVAEMFKTAQGLEVVTGITSYMTKAMTGAFSAQTFKMKGGLETLVADGQVGEEAYSQFKTFIHTFVPKFWEQGIISSKHIQSLIGDDIEGASLETALGAIGNLDKQKYLDLIKMSGGEFHPLLAHAAIEARKNGVHWMAENSDEGRELWKASNILNDLTYNIREVSYDDFALAHKTSGSDIDLLRAWTDYEELLKNDKPLLTRFPELEKFNLSDGILNTLMEGMKRGGGKGTYDDPITLIRNEIGSIKNGSEEDIAKILMDSMHRAKLVQQSRDAVLPEHLRTTYKEPFRKLRGVDAVHNFLERNLTPKRLGIAAAGGLAALAAWNLISGGDGAVEDPNDIPSVSNPTFSNSRQGMASRSTISPDNNFNSKSSLLTDHRQSFSSINESVRNGGHNTVHTRHDGSNPYRSDMQRYS